MHTTENPVFEAHSVYLTLPFFIKSKQLYWIQILTPNDLV